MKTYFYLIALASLFLFNFKCLHAQPHHFADSLKEVLKYHPKDSLKAYTYGELIWHYTQNREMLDSAKKYTDILLDYSMKLNFEPGIIKCEYYYGIIDRHKGNLQSGLQHFKNYVSHFQKAGDSSKVASGLFQAGTMYDELGEYKQSLAAYRRSLAIFTDAKYEFGMAFNFNAMAIIHRKLKNYDESIKYYQSAIKINEENQYDSELAMNYENLANVYGETDQFDTALFYYQKALDIDNRNGKKFGIASTLENMGTLYLKMDQPEKALNYQFQSLKIRKELPQRNKIAVSLNKIGQTYVALNQLNLAENYLNESLKITEELRSRPETLKNYQSLAELFEKKKDYYWANEYQKKYTLLNDSILNEEKLKQINQLETFYKTAEKDQQIELLSKENELKELKAQKQASIRNYLIGLVGILIMMAALIYYFQRNKLKSQKIIATKNEELKSIEFKRKASDLEIKALRSQMNPHFIFNCMNSINNMILKEENEDASRYLNKFSKLIRLTLENSEKSSVTLNDELSMVEAYIQLETIRFKDKIQYQILVDESIDQEEILIPSMVLQPFIENAIWHGLMHKDEPGSIKVDILEEDDQLKCTIEDNGVGREMALKLIEKSPAKTQSMGIKITEERLKLISRQKIKEWVQIIDLKDEFDKAIGTRVNISIPIG